MFHKKRGGEYTIQVVSAESTCWCHIVAFTPGQSVESSSCGMPYVAERPGNNHTEPHIARVLANVQVFSHVKDGE